MKKLLTVLIAIMLLGCGASTLSWKDVAETYNFIEETIEDPAAKTETFLKSDYLEMIRTIHTALDGFTSGIKKDDTSKADTLYEEALKLEKVLKDSEGDNADFLRLIAAKLRKLVTAAYDKTDDFDILKSEIEVELEEAESWSDEQWMSVERKPYLKWADVEDEFMTLRDDTVYELVSPKYVEEYQIEEYKDTILEGYRLIEKGVTEDTLETAKDIYSAAVALEWYTEDVSGNAAERIWTFAIQTKEYVRECLGEEIDDPDYDYAAQVESAGKWTLSILNELTMMLRKTY